jgi:predicted Zn-dependent protease
MVELFQILQQEAKRNPGSVETFFSSHPPPQDRISRLQGSAGSGGTRDSQQFQSTKARLMRMPAPKPMPRS